MMTMIITKREILFSTIIVTLLFGLGIIISRSLLPRLTYSALKTISAVEVDPGMRDRFDYIRRTEVGDFLAADTLKAIDPVSLDIPGKWLEIKREKERYTTHVHHHSDGKRSWTTTSHSWDYQEKEVRKAQRYEFLGQNFRRDEVKFRYYLKKETTVYEKDRGIWGPNVGDIRYVYYVWPKETTGVMKGEAKDKWFKEVEFKPGQTIEKIKSGAERDITSAPIAFWIVWGILIVGAVIGFYYLENSWLYDKKKEEN